MEMSSNNAQLHRRIRSADWKPPVAAAVDRRPSEPSIAPRPHVRSSRSRPPSRDNTTTDIEPRGVKPPSSVPVYIPTTSQRPSAPTTSQRPSAPTTPTPSTPSSSVFHNFLRALHPFDPKDSAVSAEDASLLTASLKPGDLILVHSVHANGWADGVVLNTGHRGWLPTNYCEVYDHPYLRNLLSALTQFWDLLGGTDDVDLTTIVRQDCVRGLIAGVRYLLEHADCLHRYAPIVLQSVGVRRMRKGLLSDLSALVQIAKRVQEVVGEPYAGDVVQAFVDDMVSKAFKVVTRAVSFMDVWSQDSRASMDGLESTAVMRLPSTSSVASDAAEVGSKTSTDDIPHQPIDSAKCFNSPNRECSSEQSAEQGVERPHPETRIVNDPPARPSMAFTRQNGPALHRLSLIKKEANATSGHLASEQLAKAHDICISHIGALIGHHLHSRPFSELVITTDKLDKACRNLLALVDEVCSHHADGSSSVQQARQEFEQRLDELTRSTQDMAHSSDSPDDDVAMLPEQSTALISVGTELIRNTGECVVRTRRLIETVGDFELKQSSLIPSPALSGGASFLDRPPSDAPQRRLTTVHARDSLEGRPVKTSPAQSWIEVGQAGGEKEPDVPPVPHLSDTWDSATPVAVTTPLAIKPLPPVPVTARRHRSVTRDSRGSNPPESFKLPMVHRSHSTSPVRKDSVGMSVSSSTETFCSVTRDSSTTEASQASTRATTPEQHKERTSAELGMTTSFASVSSLRSMATDMSGDGEAHLLQKTYANELTISKEGQVTGGSLAALVERLTMHDTAPDHQFVTAFFLTFRKFCEPRELAQALIARYDYIGDSRTVGTPVRLRIFNILKGWLETYWNAEADRDALGEIRYLALHKLKHHLPAAGERLVELTRRVTAAYCNGAAAGPLVSGVGKTSMSIGAQAPNHIDTPESVISKGQLNALRLATGGGSPCHILDFDAVELARQITLMAMKVYCEIHPEELLSMDWTKTNTKKAKNVRRMCMLNTDLAYAVRDSILAPDEAKKRAQTIKQWTKIAMHCLELHNYDSVIAIMCSIDSSVVRRLKRTWELVSKKTQARLEELEQITDIRKNYSALRARLEAPMAPCLPFLGVYLTDLTFVMAGNPKRRELPGSASETGEPVSVINFDMYTRLARIVSHLQKFQTPYHLRAVPEMQTWLQAHMDRMRADHDHIVGLLHRRSLLVEPRCAPKQVVTLDTKRPDLLSAKSAEAISATSSATPSAGAVTDRFDFFWKSATFQLRTSSSRADLHQAANDAAEMHLPTAAVG